MILISLALMLLAVAAGMFLLAQTKKENLGNFFKYVAWIIIIAGFLGVACSVTRSVCRMSGCSYGNKDCGSIKMNCGPMMQQECHKGIGSECCKMRCGQGMKMEKRCGGMEEHEHEMKDGEHHEGDGAGHHEVQEKKIEQTIEKK